MSEKKTEIVEIAMGDCRIEFYNYKGETIKPGEGNDVVRNWMWQLIGPGIDPTRVVSVEIPKLTYTENKALTIKVEMSMQEGQCKFSKLNMDSVSGTSD